jgi:hypothetical protein
MKLPKPSGRTSIGTGRRRLSAFRIFARLQRSSKLHIAFFATAILAKTIDPKADLFAIKPENAPGNANAFSARSLCHSVLVPLSAELGFSLGVSGREALNNQPYFRMTRLDDGTPVSGAGRVIHRCGPFPRHLDTLFPWRWRLRPSQPYTGAVVAAVGQLGIGFSRTVLRHRGLCHLEDGVASMVHDLGTDLD